MKKPGKTAEGKKADIVIRNLYPEIAGGRYPVKRETDRPLAVTADIPGAPAGRVRLLYRMIKPKKSPWSSVAMKKTDGDTFRGEIHFPASGIFQYSVEVRLPGRTPIRYGRDLEVYVEPPRARFAAWYEFFPRSQGKVEGKHGTFRDCERRLPDIKRMGFNVIYLPPIHPIGKTNRKGKNNSLTARPGDPGVPWSVGDATGGHTAVHPDLGTLEDFRRFARTARKAGFEVALDFTSNCSPDHPWVKEHPSWFFHNPDGTIRYAENPPKKYQDVCPLNFYPADREEMWEAVKDIFLFWAANGVGTFRVDNPHTKPDEFWEWLIREVKSIYPETIFLAEAFTDYDHLEELARCGFSQSYSYFTWRTGKNELIEYFFKLTGSYLKEFLRVNCFVNTPDILSEILQQGGKPAFMLRIALAAAICPLYGMYSGYELLENEPLVPGKESYHDSEKYQVKVRNWNRAGNIKGYIAKLNRIRKANPALQYYDNLRFFNSTDEAILFFGKVSPDGKNRILAAVNLDPFAAHTGRVTVPLELLGISSGEKYPVRELITGKRSTWRGREQYVTLDPKKNPAAIWRI
ncbi:MAG: DUF3416 domain-containing protein [Candidatus Erginobacter occultus]|nr:DUF3416 domain-containing protein [Candidatus Erginobacter occultus]